MLSYKKGKINDLKVKNIIDFFEEGDVLVFNDAKVVKAKLQGEILRNNAILDFNLDQGDGVIWQALCKPAKKVKIDDIIQIAENFKCQVIEKYDDGFIKIKFLCSENELLENLEKYGQTPIPPYIKRTDEQENLKKNDEENYQTIYAKNGTAVAAPTAGLHFTEKLFAQLELKGIKKAFVTLNVGAGTFLPVRSEKITDHKMHSEFFSINEKTANIINEAKKNGKKIIAVGTTSLRVLESISDENGLVKAGAKNTDIFIYPSYKFKIVDILITNFHLPKSTLFMLICAFIGVEEAFKIYNHAISQEYRFYSYGDCSILMR